MVLKCCENTKETVKKTQLIHLLFYIHNIWAAICPRVLPISVQYLRLGVIFCSADAEEWLWNMWLGGDIPLPNGIQARQQHSPPPHVWLWPLHTITPLICMQAYNVSRHSLALPYTHWIIHAKAQQAPACWMYTYVCALRRILTSRLTKIASISCGLKTWFNGIM